MSLNTRGPTALSVVRNQILYFSESRYDGLSAYDPIGPSVGGRGLVRKISRDEADLFSSDGSSSATPELDGNCLIALRYFDRAGTMTRFQFDSCGNTGSMSARERARHHTAVGDYLFFTMPAGAGSTLFVTSRQPDKWRELTSFSSDMREATIFPAAASSALVYLRSAYGMGDLFATTGEATAPTRLSRENVWFAPPLVAMDGVVYARASDPVHGDELWRTDGTVEGTRLLADLRPGADGSWPTELTVFDGVLYFRANGPLGSELYRSDGTAEGTRLVRDLHPRGHGSPTALVAGDDLLYFRARDESHDDILWQSDGTTEGTQPVVVAGRKVLNPLGLAWLDGALYLSLLDRLWDQSFGRLRDGHLTLISTPDPFPGASFLTVPEQILDQAGDVADADAIDWTSATLSVRNDAFELVYRSTRPENLVAHQAACHAYFDTDRRVTTGYRSDDPQFVLGAEYWLRGADLYRFTDDPTNPWELIEQGRWNYYELATPPVSGVTLSAHARGLLQGSHILLVADNATRDDFATVDDD